MTLDHHELCRVASSLALKALNVLYVTRLLKLVRYGSQLNERAVIENDQILRLNKRTRLGVSMRTLEHSAFNEVSRDALMFTLRNERSTHSTYVVLLVRFLSLLKKRWHALKSAVFLASITTYIDPPTYLQPQATLQRLPSDTHIHETINSPKMLLFRISFGKEHWSPETRGFLVSNRCENLSCQRY